MRLFLNAMGLVVLALLCSAADLHAETYSVYFQTSLESLVILGSQGSPTIVYGTITTDGVSTVNPLTDITSYSLTWNLGGPDTFDSTNSYVSSGPSLLTGPPFGPAAPATTASLTPCGDGLCALSGILSFQGSNSFLAIDFTSSKVTYAFGPDTVTATALLGEGGALMTTPLPAALPLFASGAGLVSLLAWRRKRRNAAIAA